MSTGVETRGPCAADVMSAPVVTVPPDATAWEAWAVMLAHGVRHLVVRIDGRCAGVLDDRTILALWPASPTAMRRLRVDRLVRPRTRCVFPSAVLADVARVMIEEAFDAVPVVDEEHRLVGLITAGDVIAAVARHAGAADEETECES